MSGQFKEAVGTLRSWTRDHSGGCRSLDSAGEFSSLVDRLRSGASINESVGLIPPLINPGNPNFTDITNLIDALQTAIRDNVDYPYA